MFATTIAIQFPQVQTALTHKAVEALSKKLDGEICFEKIHIKPFTTLVLKNAAIIDKNPARDSRDSIAPQIDTFFRAEYIIATFTLDGLLRQEGLHLRNAFIENAQMNLVIEDKENAEEGDSNTNNLSRIFKLKKADPNKPKNMNEIFHIKKVEIRNMGFAMKNYQMDRPDFDYDTGIDWNDLDVSNINIQARELMFKEGKMSGTAESISFRENCGYQVESISGKTVVGGGKTIVEDLRIKDLWSDVHLSMFTMSYANAKAFSDFISSVKIDGEIQPSILDFTTISHFSPSLQGNDLRLAVQGKVSGYVDNFTFTDITASSEAGGFAGTVNGRMTGIPDIENTTLKTRIKNFKLTTDGLGKFVSQWMREGNLDLSRFAKGITFKLDATTDGLLNDLDINAALSSATGGLNADIRLSDIVSVGQAIKIEGTAQTEDLNIGSIIGADIVGPATLRTGVKAQIGNSHIRSFVKIDSVLVDKLHVNGYDYSGIAGAGTLAEEAFNGTIICNDPSLNFMFQGAFALSSKTHNSRYDFYAVVGQADLNAMNIDKRGTSQIQFQTKADFTRTKAGDIFGKIDIADLVARNDNGRHDIGNINLTSHSSENGFRARLNSKFADGTYSGSAAMTQFIKDLKNITLRQEAPALFADPDYDWTGNNYDLNFKFHNSMDLLDYLMPGLYIADSTSFRTTINKDGILDAQLSSSRIAFKEQFMKGLSFNIDNTSDNLSGELSCKEVKVASLSLKDNTLQIFANDNHLGLGYRFDNGEELINRGEFMTIGDLSRSIDKGITLDMDILPTAVYLGTREWRILPAKLQFSNGETNVKDFEISSDDQRIMLSGGTSRNQVDTLTLALERFNIAGINHLTKTDLGIGGSMTGKVKLTSPMESYGLLADVICDSTVIANLPLGLLAIGSTWDEEFERFNISLKNDLNGKSNIDFKGKLTPKIKSIEGELAFDRFNIGYVQPILSSIFSEMEGTISGKLRLDGPWNSMSLYSEDTKLNPSMLRVAYTNVPYFAEGRFHMDDMGVYFDDVQITDSHSGYGNVSGSINFDHFRDITFDTRIKANDMECVNLSENQADVFYGNISATGNVSITGPVNSLVMNVDAVTSRSGQIHIPLNNITSATTSTHLLKFTEPVKEVYVDPYEIMISKMNTKKESKSDFAVKLKVNALPDVEAFMEIDKATGNVLSGRGNGTIEMEVSEEVFSINGDYTLSSGKYKFNAANIAARDFDIQNGSSIRFNGDIMESTLDIDAVYRTKTSLSTLISDTTSVSNRRTVDCGIRITEKLSNPRLEFSIEIPDLDPTIKSRVESALSTVDKVQKQFLSLIITNSFIPDEQSGIVNNSSMLYSSVTEIMANQLNSIFQKLDIPLDLGMKYQPNERGNDIFDVAVSTQLFNNRVVVNGNIGNKQYTSGSQNDVVGDLDIEIKLDRSGAFRLNIFSHSADQYTNFLDNSQRNGAGLTYQTEFNSFKSFFRNIFSSRKKRQEAKIAEEQAMIEEGRRTIEIEKEIDNGGK